MELTDELNVESCTKCPNLVDCRSQIVNGVGPTDSDVMVVGEAPGANEDEEGEPFVGRSGELLNEVLNESGHTRQDVRITNCVRCRPPENRNPTTEELDNCFGYIEEEIQQVEPEVVLGLGSVPVQRLTGEDIAVTKEVGTEYTRTFNGFETIVLVGLHPAFILRDNRYRSDFEDAIEKAFRVAGDDESLDEYF